MRKIFYVIAGRLFLQEQKVVVQKGSHGISIYPKYSADANDQRRGQASIPIKQRRTSMMGAEAILMVSPLVKILH